jgi:hypothetical protein
LIFLNPDVIRTLLFLESDQIFELAR